MKKISSHEGPECDGPLAFSIRKTRLKKISLPKIYTKQSITVTENITASCFVTKMTDLIYNQGGKDLYSTESRLSVTNLLQRPFLGNIIGCGAVD